MSAIRKLRTIYREIPDVGCTGRCWRACGPIGFTELEGKMMEQAAGEPLRGVGEDLRCPLLTDDNRCSIYEARPFICRIWGAAEDLRCPFGCRPEAPLSTARLVELFARLEEIGGGSAMTNPPHIRTLFERRRILP